MNPIRCNSMTRIIIALFLITLSVDLAQAQYFGRNQPRYRSFDFEVRETPHFDIYNYMNNQAVVDRIGQWSEMWYDHHHDIFEEEIDFQNPILIYNNHAEFQQNNAIGGNISPGTGGVTEAFKNRVVMPLTFTHQQTNHVLGHELVHAFQFNNVVRGDSTSLGNLANLPLWMSEGLAEYLSLGSTDSHTGLWMRDAVANDDIPSLKDLNSGYKYFPYRYGHAMWAFLTGLYGDQVIEPLYQNTARFGLTPVLDTILNTNAENISTSFKQALKTYYEPLIAGRSDNPPGKEIINDENSGNLNVSPVISPNGRYVVFLSEKDLISTDLFLADTRSGEILKKLVSLTSEGVDHLNYIESSGTWSPNSKRFAFIAFKKGKNALIIKDVESGDSETIYFKGVPAITNPAWSPDGQTITVTGMVEGQVDLYSINVRSKRVTQLTDDVYSEIGVNYNGDGSKIVFSYDKRSFSGETYEGKYTLDLAVMDVATQEITTLDVFLGADNVSPTFDHEGNIIFLSDRDGFRDAYKYTMESGEVSRLTTLKTGITGITQYSPAISASTTIDRIVYTVYNDHKYHIYRAESKNFDAKVVDKSLVKKVGAMLPVAIGNRTIVDENLAQQGTYPFVSTSTFKDKNYRPKFRLDYIGGAAGVGVSNNSFTTNTGLQGGIQTMFSDILGNNQMFAAASLNGSLLDFGTQVTYINRKNRLAYGIGGGHIPLRTGYQQFFNDRIELSDGSRIDVLRRDLNIIRLFNESLNAFVHFPFSTTLRLEGGVTGFYQHFRQDLQKDYYQYDSFGNLFFIGQEREKVETGDQIAFNRYYTLTKGFGGSANVALVGDNSFFGFTGPIAGHRFRLSLEQQIGIDNYFSTLVDARKYFFMRPFTLAVRAMNYNRFERETNTVYPMFVGNMGFVRGYNDVYSDASVNPTINIDRMIGSKLIVGGAEIRLPFTGPKQLALIGSGFLLSDLILFADAGVAFDEFSQISDGRATSVLATDENGNIRYDSAGNPVYETQIVKPLLAASAGVSLRVNLGNVIILEPYFARQLVSNGRWDFGFNLIPGW